MRKYEHVMIDNETLGTSADAVIMSIGAVKFSMDGAVDDAGFYVSLSTESNLAVGRVIDEATQVWWAAQPEEARKVFTEPKVSLYDGLSALTEWLGNTDGVCMWSNGADFDLPQIALAYRQCELPLPWKFWNNRCVRTFKNLPGAASIGRPLLGVAHNALSDALNQALHVQAIHKALFCAADEVARA